MGVSLRNVGAITVFAEDLAATRAFYEDVFDLEPIFEDEVSAAFSFGNTIINVLAATEAEGLVGPAPVAGPGLGARLQLTIWVDDADAACAQLTERGVTLVNGPVDRPWGQRTAVFADPAGTLWEIAQEIRD